MDAALLPVLMHASLAEFEEDGIRASRKLRTLMEEAPSNFVEHACAVLREGTAAPGARYLVAMLASNSLLFDLFMDPLSLSARETANLLGGMPELISQFLTWLLDRIGTEPYRSDQDFAARVLAITMALPNPDRMMPILLKLSAHPDDQTRSKVALAVGRANKNYVWIASKLSDSDTRVRANAVEAMWHNRSGPALALFERALNDTSNRVVGNAVLGLHLAGKEERAYALTRKLAVRPEPLFRMTAAWLMGEIGGADFIPVLQGLRIDSDPKVRGGALRAMAKIRRKS